ncbi:hypothetical protein Tco_0668139 [Tanacetum coccineum]
MNANLILDVNTGKQRFDHPCDINAGDSTLAYTCITSKEFELTGVTLIDFKADTITKKCEQTSEAGFLSTLPTPGKPGHELVAVDCEMARI